MQFKLKYDFFSNNNSNLNNSKLKPIHLLKISETLLRRTEFLRDINLSYNKLSPVDNESPRIDPE